MLKQTAGAIGSTGGQFRVRVRFGAGGAGGAASAPGGPGGLLINARSMQL